MERNQFIYFTLENFEYLKVIFLNSFRYFCTIHSECLFDGCNFTQNLKKIYFFQHERFYVLDCLSRLEYIYLALSVSSCEEEMVRQARSLIGICQKLTELPTVPATTTRSIERKNQSSRQKIKRKTYILFIVFTFLDYIFLGHFCPKK